MVRRPAAHRRAGQGIVPAGAALCSRHGGAQMGSDCEHNFAGYARPADAWLDWLHTRKIGAGGLDAVNGGGTGRGGYYRELRRPGYDRHPFYRQYL